jgi:flagellar biosynthesis/type III secretory pathway protein FliH
MTSEEWLRDSRLVRAVRTLRQVLGWVSDDAEQLLSEPDNEWAQKWLRQTIAKARAEIASAELEALLTTGPLADTVASGKSEGKSEGKQDG